MRHFHTTPGTGLETIEKCVNWELELWVTVFDIVLTTFKYGRQYCQLQLSPHRDLKSLPESPYMIHTMNYFFIKRFLPRFCMKRNSSSRNSFLFGLSSISYNWKRTDTSIMLIHNKVHAVHKCNEIIKVNALSDTPVADIITDREMQHVRRPLFRT